MSADQISIFNVLQIVFLVMLGLPVFYIFVFAFAGLFYRQTTYKKSRTFRKMAVLIPGYKEDSVIVEVAGEALKQDYPKEKFEVIVIADSFQEETIEKLQNLPIRLVQVSFEKSTKSKALNRTMEQLDDAYDIVVVLDADNIMATDFLTKLNMAFESDFIAIQGHRTAKNLNTPLAVLDAVSEEINNHIFRKGHRVLGLSSAIIGSGMAFRYGFFKKLMSTVTAVGGFDKEIELIMLKDGHTIEYLDDAYVYDEKVQKAEVFSNQRRRWLSAQLHYFRKDFLHSLKDLLFRGNVDYFDKALQFIQPPRILLLGAVLLLGCLSLIANYLLQVNPVYSFIWGAVIIGCLLAFLFSVPGAFYNQRTVKALASLPKGMWLMFGSLLRIKGANKKFIHTRHTSTTVKK